MIDTLATKINRSLFAGAILMASANFSMGASQFYTFDNGNVSGWQKLQFTTTQGPGGSVTLQVVSRNIKPLSFGFFPESAGGWNNFYGGDLRSFKAMNGGYISSRVALASPEKNSWASWWGWNDKRGNQLLEIDVTEHVGESGGKIIQNYYWFANSSGAAQGKKGSAKPQSWYNSFATYSATWANNGTSVTFRRGNSVTTTHTGGTARPNAGLKMRLSNSPWPFDGNGNTPWRFYPNFMVDNAYYQD